MATLVETRYAFYLLQYRAWELMLGAILALGIVPRVQPQWIRNGLGVLGVGLIIFAVTTFGPSTPIPGFWVLVPCMGTALIIYSGEVGETAVSRVLGLGPLVFIGLISYSLYLWHWLIFVFAQAYEGHSPTTVKHFS